MSTEAENLLNAVGDQRTKLIGVLGLTQALKIAGAAADEGEPIENLEGALEILQGAIQAVVEGLEPIMLNRAIAAQEEQPAQPYPGADVSLAKVHPAASEALERQRVRVFRAMNMVDVTAMSCDEGDVSRKGTLEAAHELLGDIAMELNEISGHSGRLPDEDEE